MELEDHLQILVQVALDLVWRRVPQEEPRLLEDPTEKAGRRELMTLAVRRLEVWRQKFVTQAHCSVEGNLERVCRCDHYCLQHHSTESVGDLGVQLRLDLRGMMADTGV